MVNGLLPDGTLIRACEVTFGYLKKQDDRIEKLEAALREIIGALEDPKGGQHVYDMRNASYVARKALEGKDGA